MNLQKFKENNPRKKVFVMIGVLLVTVVLFVRSYAVYKLKQDDMEHEQNTSFFQESDVKLAVTVDGVSQTSIPKKDSGKAISSITCDKGARAFWDYKNWTITVKNVTEARTKCQVNFVSKYTESILNGTDPVLKDGMIPVTIDNDGTVHKASLGTEWYSYANKKWANAVILNDEYVTYAENEVIPEDNIESYFVWIPRYKYQIFNDGNYENNNQELLVDNKLPSKVGEIQIVFENKNTSASNGSTVGSWLTHPAFMAFDVNGIWVGKFETGYKGSTDKTSAEKNVNEPGSVQIKPNVNSWRGIQVANAYFTSYDYKRDYDSHMMKNTEWGAVAYLQHSKYGSMNSVRINNNSNFVTGYAAINEPTCGNSVTDDECNQYGTAASIMSAYHTSIGVLASTTGNISGIYDMSGGSWDLVMGVMFDKNGKPMSGRNSKANSGFNGTLGCYWCDNDTSGLTELTTGIPFPTDNRYYDTYSYAENDRNFQRRILGDATGEMGPFAYATYGTQLSQIGSWYDDEARTVFHSVPWVMRGGSYPRGLGAGVFDFHNDSGQGNIVTSFRVVLSVSN